MKHSSALLASTIFTVVYGCACTIGSPFLVTWGSTNLFKQVMNFMWSFPIDWTRLLLEKSFGFLLVNVLFWAALFYLACRGMGRLFALARRQIK
jgi:hypothetical protein